MTELTYFLLGAAMALPGGILGMLHERHKNRARNAAYAECVECPHKTAPDALAAAHSAALAHRSDTGHHVMIVKADGKA